MELEIQGMLIKSFTKGRKKKIFLKDIWLKVILQYCPELFCLVYAFFRLFYFVLSYSGLLRLLLGCKARKKMKTRKACRQKNETARPWKEKNLYGYHEKKRLLKRSFQVLKSLGNQEKFLKESI